MAAHETELSEADPPPEPLALVGMGCVLPGGANDVREYWRTLRDGRVGIADMRGPGGVRGASYYIEERLRSSETCYSPLSGLVRDLGYDATLPFGLDEYQRLAAHERFLAHSSSQCRASLSVPPPAAGRIHMFVGATADGFGEHEDALLWESLRIGDAVRAAALSALGLPEAGELRDPLRGIRDVSRRVWGRDISCTAIDAACASGLYAIALGMDSLRLGECDLALACGVFAPGMTSSVLFAQFSGLSATACRPLDARADGVVFGAGAAAVALKRLADAERDGDKVLCVLREVGLSSDGRSPSLMEPRRAGQLLALRRAYARAGVAPDAVQYVEAHATGTQRGDLVELDALETFFGERPEPLWLGSVKSLLGHTGWVAGIASLIKVALCLQNEALPQHWQCERPHPLLLRSKRLALPPVAASWRAGSRPRVAGVNGFGFGGANAHLIVQDYVPDRSSNRHFASTPAVSPPVIVGWSINVPSRGDHFDGVDLPVPSGIPMLPDVAAVMGNAQKLAIACAKQALHACGVDWEGLRERIGVVVAIRGRTRSGYENTERIFAREIQERARERGLAGRDDVEGIARGLRAHAGVTQYSMVGTMPNVVAGRVAHAFDLTGPNLVVDGEDALASAASVGRNLLAAGRCDLVLLGAISDAAGPCADAAARHWLGRDDIRTGDGALFVVLTDRAFAERLGKISAPTVEAGGAASHRVDRSMRYYPFRFAADASHGLAECLSVVDWCATSLHYRQGALTFRSAEPPVDVCARDRSQPDLVAWRVGDRDAVRLYEPYLATTMPTPTRSMPFEGRVLLVTDQPAATELVREHLAGQLALLATSDAALGSNAPAISVRFSSDEDVARMLAQFRPTMVLLVRDLGGERLLEQRADGGARQGVLAFYSCLRALGAELARGDVTAAAVLGRGVDARGPGPLTGLIAGMLRCARRELPTARITLVASEADPVCAMAMLPVPAAHTDLFEVGGAWHTLRLRPFADRALRACSVAPGSHALVTGGARGVTAVFTDILARIYGLRVTVLGRSRSDQELLAACPAEVRELRDRTLARALDPAAVRAALGLADRVEAQAQIQSNLSRWRDAGLAVSYQQADVRDAAEVDAAVRDAVARFGPIRLVLHGAGVQVSRRMGQKPLREFSDVLGTKLDGLANLQSAINRRGATARFMLVGSITGMTGEPGTIDYAAANEALGWLASEHEGWTTLGWPGWGQVGGMVARLSAAISSRGLRPLQPAEGAAIFRFAMDHQLEPGYALLLSQREIARYELPVDMEPAQRVVSPIALTTAQRSVVAEHLVRDKPTILGALIPEWIGIAAKRPVRVVEHLTFHEFMTADRPLSLERERCPSADGLPCDRVEITSRFVHPSGRVLRPRVVHAKCLVRYAGTMPSPPGRLHGPSIAVDDPYNETPETPFAFGPSLRLLEDIVLREDGQEARIAGGAALAHPWLLFDALGRLSTLANGSDEFTLAVPKSVERIMLAAPEQTAAALASGGVRAVALRPRVDGTRVLCPEAWILTSNNDVLLKLENLEGQRMAARPVVVRRPIPSPRRDGGPRGLLVDVEDDMWWVAIDPALGTRTTPKLASTVERGLATLLSSDALGKTARFMISYSQNERIFSLGGDLDSILALIEGGRRAALRALLLGAARTYWLRAQGGGRRAAQITLLRGAVVGSGFEFALAGDLIVAEPGTVVSFPEASYGLLPGPGAYSFFRARGLVRLFEEMLWTGRKYTAQELHGAGVIGAIVEPGATHEYVRWLRGRFPAVIETMLLRRRHQTPALEELVESAEAWVETAFALPAANLRLMAAAAHVQRTTATTPADPHVVGGD